MYNLDLGLHEAMVRNYLTSLGKAGLGESKDKVILGPFSRVTICLESLDFFSYYIYKV